MAIPNSRSLLLDHMGRCIIKVLVMESWFWYVIQHETREQQNMSMTFKIFKEKGQDHNANASKSFKILIKGLLF